MSKIITPKEVKLLREKLIEEELKKNKELQKTRSNYYKNVLLENKKRAIEDVDKINTLISEILPTLDFKYTLASNSFGAHKKAYSFVLEIEGDNEIIYNDALKEEFKKQLRGSGWCYGSIELYIKNVNHFTITLIAR